eukprot:Hpha_TRINITY_DN6441_c0_g1::TRINITY_DN6441_c0_g1_i1::g.272::m.272
MAAERANILARDDLKREFTREFPTIEPVVIETYVEVVVAGQVTKEVAAQKLREQAVEQAVEEYDAQGEDEDEEGGLPIMLYTTSQTADRLVRTKCRRLRDTLFALRIKHEEFDLAQNKWIRDKLTAKAGVDTLPLLFVGTGPDGKFAGTYDSLQEVTDEGRIFDHLEELGYKHPHERPRQIVFAGGDDDEEDGES